MKLSKLIKELELLKDEVGDLEVAGVDEEAETFCNIAIGVVEDDTGEAIFITVACTTETEEESKETNNKGSLQ